METNENSFTLRMASEVPVETPAPFTNAEAMDTTPAENTLTMTNEESVKKVLEPEHVEKVEHINAEMVENEHAVNNKEDMNCEDPVQSDTVNQSPNKPPLYNSEGDHNQMENDDRVTSDEVKVVESNSEPAHEVEEPAECEEMDQDNNKETVEEPPEPESTPAPVVDEVENDVQHSEDETKVEEVSGDTQEEKVEESTEEPVVEEPQDTEIKEEEEEIDGHVEEEGSKQEEESKQQVEISDVTEKEEEIVEEKKTDEELLIDHINTAYQCLDDFMKTKDEVKIKDCMDLLTEIKTLTVKTVDSLKVLTAEQKDQGHSSKKGKRSKSTPKPSKGSSRGQKNDVGNESDSAHPFEEVNLKDIKGLAVFAKWPNSGWFYPGVVRDLALADLKTGNQNLTVTFYDGLERDMKSINIFPAVLIPTSSVLFDLDEETDLTVTGVEREDNWVKYVLTTAGDAVQVTKDFDKLAIKGAHMKSIKQTVDSQAAANKSENIVTGRRARGKSSMFNEDYVSTSSPRSTEKRKSKVVEDSKSTPAKAPAKRKSSSKDDESSDSTPSRSASKRRQVNGTKSTPRRAAKK